MKKPERCFACQGSGIESLFSNKKCNTCKGSGLVIGVYNMREKILYDKFKTFDIFQ